MNIIEILNGTKSVIKQNIEVLAELYKKETGRKVCRTCPSDIQYMLLTLKHIMKVTEFKFKKANVQYKNKKGDKVTISNSTMTNEAAVEFLKTNPKRIELFSKFPSNWKKLVSGEETVETEEQLEKRLSIEAEINAIEETKENVSKVEPESETADFDSADFDSAEAEAEAAAEAAAAAADGNNKLTAEQLDALSLPELRLKFPTIKDTSKAGFIAKILAL